MNEPKQMTTYKMADGEPICGEFAFVTDLDGWFDDVDDRTELVKETWVLQAEEVVTLYPSFYVTDHPWQAIKDHEDDDECGAPNCGEPKNLHAERDE